MDNCNLTSLIGLTIEKVEELDNIEMDNELYSDTCIVVTFSNGTIWKLASWDSEGYRSGIDMEIVDVSKQKTRANDTDDRR